MTSTDHSSPDAIKHPGFDWVDEGNCTQDGESAARFFVDAGRVIDPEAKEACRTCPVRRECVIHAYLGGPDGTMIGAGYFGGLSFGERKQLTLRQALARVERERDQPEQGRLL